MGQNPGILSGQTFEQVSKDPNKQGRRFSVQRKGQILQGEAGAGISPNTMAANIAAANSARKPAVQTSAVAKATNG